MGAELGKAMKELSMTSHGTAPGPGPKVKEAFLSIIKSMSLDNLDVQSLVQELLTLPPSSRLLSALGPRFVGRSRYMGFPGHTMRSDPCWNCLFLRRWEEYVLLLTEILNELLKYRAQVCL